MKLYILNIAWGKQIRSVIWIQKRVLLGRMKTCLSWTMMSMCERLLLAFMCVAAVVRVRVPCSISCSTCTALSQGTRLSPST